MNQALQPVASLILIPLLILVTSLSAGALERSDSLLNGNDHAGLLREGSALTDTIVFVTNVRIPTRDGVELHARLWRPDPLEQPTPTIVALTPYGRDGHHEAGMYFSRNGYVYIAADARGRGESGGTFRPLEQDGPDGADILRWAAEQPWSDGQVAMAGASYVGLVQWQTLKAGPPDALKTVIPIAPAHAGWDFPNPDGIFVAYAAQWVAARSHGRANHVQLMSDWDYWEDRYRKLHREGRAFGDLVDEMFAPDDTTFARWMRHPWYDEFWQSLNPDSADYRRLEIPILTVAGYFDGDQPGAMKYFRSHTRWGTDTGVAKHHLVLGPWDHSGASRPRRELNGLIFADTAAIDMRGLQVAWYDWVLKGGPKPSFLEDQILYYVMGKGTWKSAPTLEVIADTSRVFYLTSPNSDASDVFSSGELTETIPSQIDVDQYVYDPREGENVEMLPSMANIGRFEVQADRSLLPGPKLVYHSSPLAEPVEVAGYMRLEAWIELDVPDTDIGAWVYELRSDGEMIFLARSLLRARHRMGVDRSELVEPGEILPYTFGSFYWLSRELKAGSRLRLVIAPINTPAMDKNYQSGGNTITETVNDARTGTVRLHTGPDHLTRLVLPVTSR